MTFRNFRLADATYATGLEALGLHWDLHAFAELIDLTYTAAGNFAQLKWLSPAVENPWGDKKNKYKGCILEFRNVSTLLVAQPELDPTDEDDCVASISVVAKPAVIFDSGEFRVRDSSEAGENDLADMSIFRVLQVERSVTDDEDITKRREIGRDGAL